MGRLPNELLLRGPWSIAVGVLFLFSVPHLLVAHAFLQMDFLHGKAARRCPVLEPARTKSQGRTANDMCTRIYLNRRFVFFSSTRLPEGKAESCKILERGAVPHGKKTDRINTLPHCRGETITDTVARKGSANAKTCSGFSVSATVYRTAGSDGSRLTWIKMAFILVSMRVDCRDLQGGAALCLTCRSFHD